MKCYSQLLFNRNWKGGNLDFYVVTMSEGFTVQQRLKGGQRDCKINTNIGHNTNHLLLTFI